MGVVKNILALSDTVDLVISMSDKDIWQVNTDPVMGFQSGDIVGVLLCPISGFVQRVGVGLIYSGLPYDPLQLFRWRVTGATVFTGWGIPRAGLRLVWLLGAWTLKITRCRIGVVIRPSLTSTCK